MGAVEKEQLVAVVEGVFEDHQPTPADKRRQYAATAGKGVALIGSVILSAYLSMQQAISDTRTEVREQVTEMERKLDTTITKGLDERRSLEMQIVELRAETRNLATQISVSFEEVKEELRYLRRRRSTRTSQ